ncbi:hypothetical protein ScPMuIL_002370 [Solemya velum]
MVCIRRHVTIAILAFTAQYGHASLLPYLFSQGMDIFPNIYEVCHPVTALTNGRASCLYDSMTLTCTGNCDDTYRFPDRNISVMLTCDAFNGWSTASSFDACVSSTGTGTGTGNCVANNDDCRQRPNGDYQFCGDCHYFVSCADDGSFVRQCPISLQFDDNAKRCMVTSTTCSV